MTLIRGEGRPSKRLRRELERLRRAADACAPARLRSGWSPAEEGLVADVNLAGPES